MSDDNEKRDVFTRLIEEEDASAAVEFMVLVPVYILMMTALFMFGNLVLARYALVHGVRYVAWHPQTNSLSDSNFPAIKPYPGTLQIGAGDKSGDVTIQSGDISAQGQETSRMGDVSNSAKGNGEKIADHVVNNKQGKPQMKWGSAKGSFDYRGVVIGGMQIKQDGARAAVYLPQNYTRKEYSGSGKHPALDWKTGNEVDASAPEQAFFSPKFAGHFDRPDGVWDPKARIQGSIMTELEFYRPRMR